ncbi:MAG: tyrosine-protein phosphatase [Cryobacterium sp.]|nr:tyrosine-protein phosphatase [Oligoflexia bacterium]
MRLQTLVFGCITALSLSFTPARASIERFLIVNSSLVRGGQPTVVQDFIQLKKNGIRTVIDLRTTGEMVEWERRVVQNVGMNFRSFPIDGMSYPSEALVGDALKAMRDPRLQPVFIHCHAGKDRTGLLVGLYRVSVMGWKPTDAYEEMLKIGFDPNLIGLRNFFWDHLPLRRVRTGPNLGR